MKEKTSSNPTSVVPSIFVKFSPRNLGSDVGRTRWGSTVRRWAGPLVDLCWKPERERWRPPNEQEWKLRDRWWDKTPRVRQNWIAISIPAKEALRRWFAQGRGELAEKIMKAWGIEIAIVKSTSRSRDLKGTEGESQGIIDHLVGVVLHKNYTQGCVEHFQSDPTNPLIVEDLDWASQLRMRNSHNTGGKKTTPTKKVTFCPPKESLGWLSGAFFQAWRKGAILSGFDQHIFPWGTRILIPPSNWSRIYFKDETA